MFTFLQANLGLWYHNAFKPLSEPKKYHVSGKCFNTYLPDPEYFYSFKCFFMWEGSVWPTVADVWSIRSFF